MPGPAAKVPSTVIVWPVRQGRLDVRVAGYGCTTPITAMQPVVSVHNTHLREPMYGFGCLGEGGGLQITTLKRVGCCEGCGGWALLLAGPPWWPAAAVLCGTGCFLNDSLPKDIVADQAPQQFGYCFAAERVAGSQTLSQASQGYLCFIIQGNSCNRRAVCCGALRAVQCTAELHFLVHGSAKTEHHVVRSFRSGWQYELRSAAVGREPAV